MSQQFIHLNTKHFVFLDLCAYFTITIQLFAWRNFRQVYSMAKLQYRTIWNLDYHVSCANKLEMGLPIEKNVSWWKRIIFIF
jgi:hypothetical protein